MIWDSWNDFIAIGGYGRYVWGSLAAVALALAIEQWTLRTRNRAAEQRP
jgi:heme exporter protein D